MCRYSQYHNFNRVTIWRSQKTLPRALIWSQEILICFQHWFGTKRLLSASSSDLAPRDYHLLPATTEAITKRPLAWKWRRRTRNTGIIVTGLGNPLLWIENTETHSTLWHVFPSTRRLFRVITYLQWRFIIHDDKPVLDKCLLSYFRLSPCTQLSLGAFCVVVCWTTSYQTSIFSPFTKGDPEEERCQIFKSLGRVTNIRETIKTSIILDSGRGRLLNSLLIIQMLLINPFLTRNI
jgi:hypothetical protein